MLCLVLLMLPEAHAQRRGGSMSSSAGSMGSQSGGAIYGMRRAPPPPAYRYDEQDTGSSLSRFWHDGMPGNSCAEVSSTLHQVEYMRQARPADAGGQGFVPERPFCSIVCSSSRPEMRMLHSAQHECIESHELSQPGASEFG